MLSEGICLFLLLFSFFPRWCDFFSSSQKKSGCAYQLFGVLIVEPLWLFLLINQTHCTAITIMKADRYIKRFRCYTFTLFLPAWSCRLAVIMYLEFSCCPIGRYLLIYQNSLFSPVLLYMKHTMWTSWFTKANVYLTYLLSLGWTLEFSNA